jgi:2-keto-4-pentenoate hydratase/2-oxohepta-3-ene-1,7-dioic acid hydratase in catechol pathway
MIFCRFSAAGSTRWGLLEDHEVFEVTPDIFSDHKKTRRSWPMADVQLLAPTTPSKIVAVGLNYKDHIEEFGRREIPQEPVLFLKPPSSVIGPDAVIRRPPQSQRVDYEAELAVVIKKHADHVSEADASDYILGITALNDVTARDLQKTDKQWTRSKSFDTFCPIGPWICDGLPFQNLRVEAYVNQKQVQAGHTSHMIFSVPRLVSFISSVMTLEPGDVITTGTPVGVGPLQKGDVVEIFVEGVGKLRNTVQ